MQKVIIIGCPGSGKSTFARLLHEKTHLPLVYLDMLFWNADRTTVTREIFDQRLDQAMRGEQWIIDGNYSRTMEQRIAACDTVFFLDYPTEVCLDSIRKRRGQARPDMPWIEREDDADYGEFLAFVSSFSTDRRPQIIDLLARYPHKTVHHFTSREEAQHYLDKITTIQEAQYGI